MMRRTFFLAWIGMLLTTVGAGLAYLPIGNDDAVVVIVMATSFGFTLGPFVGLVALFVFGRAKRWVEESKAADARARRAFMKVGALFLQLLLVAQTVGFEPDWGTAIVVSIIVIVVTAALGALGGSLIWKRGVETPRTAPV